MSNICVAPCDFHHTSVHLTDSHILTFYRQFKVKSRIKFICRGIIDGLSELYLCIIADKVTVVVYNLRGEVSK